MKSYVILPNRKWSTYKWMPSFKRVFTFEFLITSNSRNAIKATDEKDVKNTVCGFVDCALTRSQGSFRIAWDICDDGSDRIRMFAITSHKGEEEVTFLKYITPFQPVSIEVKRVHGVFRILIDGFIITYVKDRRKSKCNFKQVIYPDLGAKNDSYIPVEVKLKV